MITEINILIDIHSSAVFVWETKENSYLVFCHYTNYSNLSDHIFSTTYFIVEQAKK
jgi:hypothetical protein